jgi:DNA-binding MarR family transcriptional regulator
MRKIMKQIETTSFVDHMGYWLRRLSNSVHYEFEHALAEKGVTTSQFCVLITIFKEKINTPIEIARFIEIDNAAVTRLVDRLIAKNLIKRVPNPVDRRSVYLELTEQGETLTPQLADIGDEIQAVFFQSLSEEERKTLKQLMNKLLMENSIDTSRWRAP